MRRSELEMYYLSMAPIQKMLTDGVISKNDYLKSESFIAGKYCIKTGNLYRLNDLTNLSK